MNKILSYPLLTTKKLIIITLIYIFTLYFKNWLDYRIIYLASQVIELDKQNGAVEEGDGEPAPLNQNKSEL